MPQELLQNTQNAYQAAGLVPTQQATPSTSPTQVNQNLFAIPGETTAQYQARIGYTPTAPVSLGDVSPSFSSSLYSTAPKSSFDIQSLLQKNMEMRQKQYADLQASLTPSTQETQLQTQLADLRQQADQYNLNLQKQQVGEFGLGRPVGIAQGYAERDVRLAQLDQSNFALQEKNLLTRLGIEQENRKAKSEVAKVGLDASQSDLDTTLKIQQAIQQQEQFVLSYADKMTDNARTVFSSVLDKFKGLDFEELPPAVQQQVTVLAGQAGIPYEAVVAGMKAVKDQQLFQNQNELSKLALQQQRINVTVQNQGNPNQSFQNIDGQVMQVLTDKQGNVIGMTPLGQSSTAATKSKDAIAAFNSASQLLTTIDNLSKKVVTASNVFSAGTQYLSKTFGALTKSNQDAALFKDTINAFTSQLARASGEKGVLTDQDVARIRKALPGLSDTAGIAQAKIQQLRQLFSGIQQGVSGAYGAPTSTTSSNDPLGIR
jgi:hypothetical protein